MAQERLDRRPAAEEQETQQQNSVAAEGGDVSNVGGTPVTAASPEAPATSTTRRFMGVVGNWWYKTRPSTTPHVQVRDEDPGRVVDESAEPSLGDTPAVAIHSSHKDARSQLDSKFRMNLQKMSGTR